VNGEPITAEEFVDHLVNCGPTKPDAMIVCDTGVNGDDVIATMVNTGYWRLSDRVEYLAGKRIRTLVPNEDAIIAAATQIHDAQCRCDPRYLMSCTKMAAAILRVGREGRP
jgi:hypothetical protein